MFVAHWWINGHYLHIFKLNLNKSKTKIVVVEPNHWPKIWSVIDVGHGNICGSDDARNTAVILYHKLLFNLQVATICKSSFHVRNIALLFFRWSVETFLLREDSIIVFRYYMCFKGLNSLTRAIVNERKYYLQDTKMEVNVYLLPNNFSVLSHFQVFLRAEMHILIFLAVGLLAPPCADSLSMI